MIYLKTKSEAWSSPAKAYLRNVCEDAGYRRPLSTPTIIYYRLSWILLRYPGRQCSKAVLLAFPRLPAQQTTPNLGRCSVVAGVGVGRRASFLATGNTQSYMGKKCIIRCNKSKRCLRMYTRRWLERHSKFGVLAAPLSLIARLLICCRISGMPSLFPRVKSPGLTGPSPVCSRDSSVPCRWRSPTMDLPFVLFNFLHFRQLWFFCCRYSSDQVRYFRSWAAGKYRHQVREDGKN